MAAEDKKGPAKGDATSEEQAKPRKSRLMRWVRRLLVLIVLLGLLAWGAPWLLSTGPGTKLLVWAAGRDLKGTLEIDQASLSWTSPARIKGLRIKDPQGREVVNVAEVSVSRGLWALATKWEHFGEVGIAKPAVNLYVQPNGRTSLEEVLAKYLEPKEETPPDPETQKRVQELRGSLGIEGGTIRLVAMDGQELLCEQLEVTVEARTLKHLAVDVGLAATKLPLPPRPVATPAAPAGPTAPAAPPAPAAPAKPRSGSGTLKLVLSISRPTVDASTTLGGTVDATVLDETGAPMPASPAKLVLTDLIAPAGGGQTTLAKLDATVGKLLTVIATNVTAAGGAKPNLGGKLVVKADLAPCIAWAGLLTGKKDLPAIAGQLAWEAQAASKGNGFTVNTVGEKGKITNFAAGKGADVYKEDLIAFEHNVEYNPDGGFVDLRGVKIAGKYLTAWVQGDITKLDTTKELGLDGGYQGDWEKLTILLHELVPSLKGNLAWRGPLAGKFTLTGPADDPKFKAAIEGVGATAGLGWTSGDAWGLLMGPAKLDVLMSAGQIKVPTAPIPVTAGGTINLGGTVDLRGKAPRYALPGETQLLDKVRINPKFGQKILSFVNPVFAQATELDGTVSARVKGIDVPLGADILKSGKGSGHMDFSDLRLRPAGMLGKLLSFGGIGGSSAQLVKLSPIDFELKDGQLTYKNFTMIFPGNFDLQFSGFIGLDNSVNMMVSVPVRAGVLGAFGMKGAGLGIAKDLEDCGVRFDVPIVGDRLSPKLGKFDPKPAIEKAIKVVLKKKGLQAPEDLIKGILGGKAPGGVDPGKALEGLFGGGKKPDGKTPTPGGLIPGLLPGTKKPDGKKPDGTLPKPGELIPGLIPGTKKPADKKPDGKPDPADLLKGLIDGGKKQ